MQAEKVTKISCIGKIIFHVKEKYPVATFWRKKIHATRNPP